MAADEAVPCALAGPAGLVPLFAVGGAQQHLGRYASTAVAGQLLACRWPCRVWWAQLAATPLGAAAEEWQPLVPAAYDSLGDSL